MSRKIILPGDPGYGLERGHTIQSLERPATVPITSNLGAVGSGMFPAAFNKLREVLYNEHADLWEICGGMLIYNHEMLFTYLNTQLDTTCDPRMTMSVVCDKWLDALAKRPKCWRAN